MPHLQQAAARLNGLSNKSDAETLLRLFDRYHNHRNLVSGSLRITGGSAAATWETQNTVIYMVRGVPCVKTAVTAQAVPSGCTWAAAASTFNAACFLITLAADGTVATAAGQQGSGTSAANALAGILWPRVPNDVVVIGAAIVRNTTANVAFTAGTTNLDASNISTTFVDVINGWPVSAPI